jgi:predicted acylesterase/phospholipase RssA
MVDAAESPYSTILKSGYAAHRRFTCPFLADWVLKKKEHVGKMEIIRAAAARGEFIDVLAVLARCTARHYCWSPRYGAYLARTMEMAGMAAYLVCAWWGILLGASACPPIDTLIFQGGGVRGVAYAAVPWAIEGVGIETSQLRRVAGTSAGSQAAVLLAVGYNASEFYHETMGVDFSSLIETNGHTFEWPHFRPLGDVSVLRTMWHRSRGLFERFGLFSGGRIQDSLNALIARKLCAVHTGRPTASVAAGWPSECDDQPVSLHDMTFAGLRDFNREHRRPDIQLSMPATDITDGFRTRFLHVHTEPDMPIALAARASSAIPFVFEPVEWPPGVAGGERGHLLVDGGIARNLPLDAFDCSHFSTAGDLLVSDCDDFSQGGQALRALAFKLGASPRPITADHATGPLALKQYATSFMIGMRQSQSQDCDTQRPREAGLVHVVELSTLDELRGLSAIDFQLNSSSKSKAVVAAYQRTREELSKLGCPSGDPVAFPSSVDMSVNASELMLFLRVAAGLLLWVAALMLFVSASRLWHSLLKRIRRCFVRRILGDGYTESKHCDGCQRAWGESYVTSRRVTEILKQADDTLALDQLQGIVKSREIPIGMSLSARNLLGVKTRQANSSLQGANTGSRDFLAAQAYGVAYWECFTPLQPWTWCGPDRHMCRQNCNCFGFVVCALVWIPVFLFAEMAELELTARKEL